MPIPNEPIGSIPRPAELVAARRSGLAGAPLEALYDAAVRDTLRRFEETGSRIVTDGEQRKPSFATYPIEGLDNLVPGGVTIPFADGHTRQLPSLARGPFRYATRATGYLEGARRLTALPVKQAVISASALSLLYPAAGIAGYSRAEFVADLVREAEADIRGCLDAGADSVQIDFTEARLSLKLDPSGGLLRQFVELNNRVLARFSDAERRRLGVHTCPGGDLDSTHSADVDYAGLLPELFRLEAGRFYVQLASEPDRRRVLEILAREAPADAMLFVGVVDPINARVETPEEVRDRVLEAAEVLPLDRLGATDDCGFAPFGDDTSTSRETAFAKIRARVEGTRLAADRLGV
jgi:5-methyltetrahydropteroyltriglutamate--homocysteine methyltransferase